MLRYKVKLQKYKAMYSEIPPKKSTFLQKCDSNILHDLVCEWISKWHWIFSILFIYLFVFMNSLFSLLLSGITTYQEVVNHLIIDTDKMAPQWSLESIRIVGIFLHPKQIHAICQKHVHAIFTPRWMRISAQNKQHICCSRWIIGPVTETGEDGW